ncbi:hypothetical protein PGT21_010402 [Puccinia graminis f. sp. tritici]|uniref:Uncharacterized protein n=1 Tax=Puccinia graminis f. sp. tritici TaxID=56615 RepID=A0A5B0ML43_PUCGR|nr:hypothetical protein PGT21_010402 [Puccinia graminis f. sp. tritici]KAA1098665.1 hypothetical protein PGTUg99_013866 [Puccinia graminis f. sp. tritici]
MRSGTSSSSTFSSGASSTGNSGSSSAVTTTSQTSMDSQPSRELKKVIAWPPKNVLNPSAGLDDFGRAYLNLIGYLKTVWASREGKKAGRESKIKKRSGTRPTRALELQLKLQQERIRCEWLADGQPSWRVHRSVDPYGPIDLPHPDLANKNLLSTSPLGSIHPPPSLQAAK